MRPSSSGPPAARPWQRLAIAALVLLAAAAAATAATIGTESVRTPDGRRSYLLAVPDTRSAAPMPLVLLLHGHGGSAANVLGRGIRPSPLSAWLSIADREHVILAALQGASGPDGQPGWNDCRRDAAGSPATDDVAFARLVVEHLVRQEHVDPSRVYAMGMSNGAMMAFRLALELEPPLAGFAAVSGSMAADSQCGPPVHPVAALIIGGTADPLVPWGGGAVRLGRRRRGEVVGAERSALAWVRANGLGGPPHTERLPHRNGAADGTSAVRSVWGSSPRQVELVRIENGGHVEPSLRFHYGPAYAYLVGPQNRDLESGEEAWRFLRDKHAQAGPAGH